MATKREAIALGEAAVDFLAADPALLGQFLAEAGAAPQDVPAMADDPAFLGAALSFLAQDEERAAAFCEGEGLSAETFLAARALLSGDGAHWI